MTQPQGKTRQAAFLASPDGAIFRVYPFSFRPGVMALTQLATALSVYSSHRNLRDPMTQLSRDLPSPFPRAAERSIQAIMNLLYLIRITPNRPQEIDIYLELAEMELERLTLMLPHQSKESHG
jgi:hypothetical protein